MAKKRHIRNMTRAQHKQVMEKAVMLQNAAIHQVREKTVSPKFDSNDDAYTQVVKTGQEILQKEQKYSLRIDRIRSYYSRKDVQDAMFGYSKGRKISVLKYFHPMFAGSQLRQAEDILPMMMFYSQESSLWPSMHGTVSRYDDNGRLVCDLVVEIDCKKSRTRCFNLTRPLIKLFTELELEFLIKYSGNASPHVIIPGEVFPERWRRGGNCRRLYNDLLNFFKKQIREPNLLDRSFGNSNHFLRMLYSLNENTGLASIPIRIEDFDRFSWQDAYPEQVSVIDDWWEISDDASEKTEALISFVMGEKRTIAMPKAENNLSAENLPQSMPELISKNTQIGIMTAGSQMIEQIKKLSESLDIDVILNELKNEKQSLQALAQKYGISKGDLMLLQRYSDKSKALEYYSREDIQEYIYSYAIGRCVRLGNTDQYLMLDKPSDIYLLSAYMIGEGIPPTFQCTNAKYDPEDENIISCDIVVQLAQSNLDLSGLNGLCFGLYNGDGVINIIFPYESLKTAMNIDLSRLSEITYAFRKYFKGKFKITRSLPIFSYESSTPIPYTLTDGGDKAYIPICIEHIKNFSPLMADISAIGDLNNISFENAISEDFSNEIKSILGKGDEI